MEQGLVMKKNGVSKVKSGTEIVLVGVTTAVFTIIFCF
jgi:hypothetical protein